MFRLISQQTPSVQSMSLSLSRHQFKALPRNLNNLKPNQNRLAVCNVRFATVASDSMSDYDDSISASKKGKFMLILGKPGGGKGTISNKILNDFPAFKHLSTGDLLRQHVREATPIGLQAKKHMDKGDLVPDEIMIQLVLQDAFGDGDSSSCDDSNDSDDAENNKSLLLDGFPRTMEQAVALDESLEVDLVVDLDVPVDTIVERISDRWIHPGSGRIYNYSYNPPKVHGKDDMTGEDLIQREDDKPETVRKRLEAYDKVTAPLIQYYTDKGVLKTFKGTKSDVIYVDVKNWLDGQME